MKLLIHTPRWKRETCPLTAACSHNRGQEHNNSFPVRQEHDNRFLLPAHYREHVDKLKSLKEMGLREISLGVESGDDWTLDRVHKGYYAEDICEQCGKLTEAGIDFWMSFLNGVAGKEHSMDHAIHSAEVFSKCDH